MATTTKTISGGCGCCGEPCSEYAVVLIYDYMMASRQFGLKVSPYFGQATGVAGTLDGNNGEFSYVVDTVNFRCTITTHADLIVVLSSHCGSKVVTIPAGTVLVIEQFHQQPGNVNDFAQATIDENGNLEIMNLW